MWVLILAMASESAMCRSRLDPSGGCPATGIIHNNIVMYCKKKKTMPELNSVLFITPHKNRIRSDHKLLYIPKW